MAVLIFLIIGAVPVTIIYLNQHFNEQNRKGLYDLSVKYLEHGKEIPSELITAPVPVRTEKSNVKLLVGLVAMSIALAFVSVVFTVDFASLNIHDSQVPFAIFTAFATLFAAIGISFIIVWIFERRRKI